MNEVTRKFLRIMQFFLAHFIENSSRRKLHYPDTEVRRTVEFAGKLLIRISRKPRDVCWPLIGRKKYFFGPIRGQHSNKSRNWFVKGSIPGFLSSVLENFRRRFSRPNWPPLSFRGWNESMQVSYFSRLRKEARSTRKTRGICGTTAPHGIFCPNRYLVRPPVVSRAFSELSETVT